jgi:hypothetical protein
VLTWYTLPHLQPLMESRFSQVAAAADAVCVLVLIWSPPPPTQMLPPVILAAAPKGVTEAKKAALTHLTLTHESRKLAGYAEVRGRAGDLPCTCMLVVPFIS